MNNTVSEVKTLGLAKTLATAWLAVEPDEHYRSELEQHLSAASAGAASTAWLAEHFGVPLTFGTAGLRGAMGPGPAYMNRVLVRTAARAIGRVLLTQADAGTAQAETDTAQTGAGVAEVGTAGAGVVIGFDARPGSEDFAKDSAQVLVAMGIPAALISQVVPTPVLARQLLVRQAAAAIMVTASHNPRDDNGYKVYWSDGTQIRPPIDALIEAEIQAQLTQAQATQAAGGGLVSESDLAPFHKVELIEPAAAIADYVGAAISPPSTLASLPEVRLVYTALSGVGADTLSWAFSVAGLAPPTMVEQQCQPDGSFAGLPFPNPEEPGTLDAAKQLAQDQGIDLVLANDPDADRLAVAIRTGSASDKAWRQLTGDELGVLLCDQMISKTAASATSPNATSPNTTGQDATSPNATGQGAAGRRLAASSVVSGSMVEALCQERGVEHYRTLTGFKWVMLPRVTNPDAAWVFGYEEALGYSVSDTVLDKDGISAAVEFVRLTQNLAARGIGPLERLDELAQEVGVFETRQVSVRSSADAIAKAMGHLRSNPPNELTNTVPKNTGPENTGPDNTGLDSTGLDSTGLDSTVPLSKITDWSLLDPPQRTNLIEMRFDTQTDTQTDTRANAETDTQANTQANRQLNRRISVRPSGTEPKVKIYLEVSSPGPAAANELTELRQLCHRWLDAMSETATAWFD